MAAVGSFVMIIFVEWKFGNAPLATGSSWVNLVSAESATIVLLLVGIVCALLGLRLLTTTQNALARTIPRDDLPMIEEAVKQGKSDAIDQYVRLRSLTGWAGTFTKLGVTGLPLVTVVLTLIFAFIALLQVPTSKDFLDLAKLTLGAFIGSFVQRNVEWRKQDSASANADAARPSNSLPI
jgi:hypothetical protein